MNGLYAWNGSWEEVHGLPHPAVHDLEVVGKRLLVCTEAGLAVYALPASSG